MRVAAAITCFVIALVSGYVFLANFEYPGVTTGKIVSGSLAGCFLVGAVILARKKRELA